MEYHKKVLEFAQTLNISIPKGKPGKDILKFGGTIDRDSLKAMEESIDYESIKINPNLAKIEQEVINLALQDQLELIEKMINHIKEGNLMRNEPDFSWDQFYGIAKGLWEEDAQEYVDHLREER